MKNNQLFTALFAVLSLFLNITVAYSLNYTINFTSSGVSAPLDSVIVQNITKGTRAIVRADGVLNLKDEPNALNDVTSNDETIHIYPSGSEGVSVLSFYAKKISYAQINAYNLNGVQIAGVNTLLQAKKNSFELSLPRGIFIIQIVGDEYKYTAKTCNLTSAQTKPRIVSVVTEKSTLNGPQKSKNIVQTNMFYSPNDFLVFKGKSGNYITTITDIPTCSKTINFVFAINESPDFVTFSDNKIPLSWAATNWSISSSLGYDDYYSMYCQISTSCSMIKTYLTDGVFEYYDFVNTYFNSSDPDQSLLYIDNNKATPYYERMAKKYNYGMGYWKQKVYTVSAGTHTFKFSTLDYHSSAQIDVLNFAPEPALTQITTSAISSIKGDAATSGGNVVFDKYTPVNQRGLCWGLTSNPTISDNKIISGNGMGSFVTTITNLTPNTTYYTRAYAINSVGISYGNEISFKTASEIILPTLTTVTLADIKSTTVIGGGNIVSDGNSIIQSRGVCWSTSPNPTIDNNNINAGTGIGNFTANISNLTPHTTYYIRAYATNSAGTGYGNELSFTTPYFDLGQNYQGGIIAYIDETGQHGIIAAPSDQGVNINWGNGLNITTGATDSIIGSGQNNTLKIVTAFGSGNYAAKVCYDLVLNGYDDWFLPSINELEKLYLTQEIVGGYNGSCSSYISSTEYDINKAADRDFFKSSNGVAQGLCRGWDVRIRAIRYF